MTKDNWIAILGIFISAIITLISPILQVRYQAWLAKKQQMATDESSKPIADKKRWFNSKSFNKIIEVVAVINPLVGLILMMIENKPLDKFRVIVISTFVAIFFTQLIFIILLYIGKKYVDMFMTATTGIHEVQAKTVDMFTSATTGIHEVQMKTMKVIEDVARLQDTFVTEISRDETSTLPEPIKEPLNIKE